MRGPTLLAPLGAALVAIMSAGCQTGLPRPKDDGLRQPASAEQRAEVAAWIERVRSERALRTSIRAYARVRLVAEQGKARVREVILAERPSRLRVETLSFLGQTQSLLVADAGEAWLFDGQQLVSDGTPTELLARLGLDLDPGAAIDLLLAAPDVPEGTPRGVFIDAGERVAVFDGLELGFAASGELARVDAFDEAGDRVWTVAYAEWGHVPGGRYPLVLRAYFPRTDLAAEFAIEEVELNVALDRELFRIARTLE